jgi:hypothetical protein
MIRIHNHEEIRMNTTLLPLNGAGTKAAILHNSKGHPKYNILSINLNGKFSNSPILYSENIISGVPFQGSENISDSDTASAVVVAIMPADLDRAFESNYCVDTNYIPQPIYQNHHKFKDYEGFYTFSNADERLLDGHLELMYKCMLVQANNYHKVWKDLVDSKCDEVKVTPQDIERSLYFWAPRLGFPQKETAKRIELFMKKVTQDKIDSDSQIASGSAWRVRIWFDGDNWQERFRIVPDVKLLPIYEYGHKDASFEKIVTYDGDMCLKMSSDVRAELQAWYESNPRQCRKEFTKMLKERFVEGKDVNGIEHDFNSLFRSLKNRKVKAAQSFNPENLKRLIELYPSQFNAVKFVNTSLETRNSSVTSLSA